MIEQAEQLAAKAYPIALICDALNIGLSTIYTKSYVEVLEATKRGRVKAKMVVIDALMKRTISDQSPTALIYLSKSLKIFDIHFTTSTPKTAAEATKRIAKLYEAVAKNELDGEKADRLCTYLTKYISAIDITEIERRLTELEKN